MINHDFMFDVDIIIGIGNSNAISTSKIIKISGFIRSSIYIRN